MSNTITVELFGHPGNNAVIRMPGRQSVGVVIQLDTLKSLVEDASELAIRVRDSVTDIGILDDSEALLERLQELLIHVESEMKRAGDEQV